MIISIFWALVVPSISFLLFVMKSVVVANF